MTSFIIRQLRGCKWFILGIVCGGVLIDASAAPPAVAPAPVPAGQEATLIELATARYQVAAQGYSFAIAGHQPGDAPGADAIDWMRRRVRARLDIVEPKNDRVAFLKEYVEMLKQEEAFQERMVKSRLTGAESLLRAQYDRIEGEMLLQQAQAK